MARMNPVKEFISNLLPERFVWLLSRMLYKIGYYKPFLWDISQSERIVEYGWVSKNIDIEEGRVLDVGCCGTFFPLQLAGMGLEVWGLDKKECELKHKNFKFVKGNILDADLPRNSFDIITLISTVEHIGLREDGDFKCMERLHELLKDNGNLIVTAPFGKPHTFEGYRVYDMQRIRKMWKGKIKKINFFMVDKTERWSRVSEEEASAVEMKSRGECTAIFCAVLVK